MSASSEEDSTSEELGAASARGSGDGLELGERRRASCGLWCGVLCAWLVCVREGIRERERE